MHNFFKENLIHILTLLLVSLLLIFCGRIVVSIFLRTTACENLETLDDRIRCAKYLGWEVDRTSETVKNVYIPKENTVEFNLYNEMQKSSGFDLSSYMGKGVDCYTYRILNFPSQNEVNAFLNIMIYDGKMIGGDCDVLEYDELYLPVRRMETNAYIP